MLSRFAGAVEQLTEALIINPCDADAMAKAMRMALEMPRAQRTRRRRAMMREIERYDVHRWQRDFLDASATARQESPVQAQTAA